MPDIELEYVLATVEVDADPETTPVVIEIAARGEPGVKGDKGDKGDPGTNGADGNTILDNEGTPSSDLGVDGNFCLDTINAILYGPKAGGSWGTGISLIPEVPAFTVSVSTPTGGEDGDVWFQVV